MYRHAATPTRRRKASQAKQGKRRDEGWGTRACCSNSSCVATAVLSHHVPFCWYTVGWLVTQSP